MNRKELEALLLKLDFDQLKEVSDEQAASFDDTVSMSVALTVLEMFMLKRPANKKIDNAHSIQIHKSVLPDSHILLLRRKIHLDNDSYRYAKIAWHIVFNGIKWKFDCLNDSFVSNETVHKLYMLRERVELLEAVAKIEQI